MASKRGNQGEGSGGARKKSKTRGADVSGFCPETITSRLNDMEYHIKENGEGQKLFAYHLDKQTLNGHIFHLLKFM